MITVIKSDLSPLEVYIEFLINICDSRMLTNNGKLSQLFVQKLKEYLRLKDLAVVSNGILAFQLTLKSIFSKDDVITTPFTFIATTNVLIRKRYKPIFLDIIHATYNFDSNDIERKITSDTVAILAVHVYGNPCYVEHLQENADIERIAEIIRKMV